MEIDSDEVVCNFCRQFWKVDMVTDAEFGTRGHLDLKTESVMFPLCMGSLTYYLRAERECSDALVVVANGEEDRPRS